MVEMRNPSGGVADVSKDSIERFTQAGWARVGKSTKDKEPEPTKAPEPVAAPEVPAEPTK